jgi:hypothetical protein
MEDMLNSGDFEIIRDEFSAVDVGQKVQMYVSTEGLSQDQYKELLQFFPINQLHLLEEALQ